MRCYFFTNSASCSSCTRTCKWRQLRFLVRPSQAKTPQINFALREWNIMWQQHFLYEILNAIDYKVKFHAFLQRSSIPSGSPIFASIFFSANDTKSNPVIIWKSVTENINFWCILKTNRNLCRLSFRWKNFLFRKGTILNATLWSYWNSVQKTWISLLFIITTRARNVMVRSFNL